MSDLVLIAAKVSPETADALKAHAKGQRKSVSQVVRDLVVAKLKEYEL